MKLHSFIHRMGWTVLLSLGIHLLFSHTLQLRQYRGEHQIYESNFYIKCQRLISSGYDTLRYHKHLCHRDIGCQGGILDHCNQGVGQRRESGSQRLRQHNPPHGLKIRHSHTVSGFQLPGRDGFQCRPHGFRRIGSLVNREYDHCTRAVITAIQSASVKEIAVSGIVIVRPGSRIFQKESVKI